MISKVEKVLRSDKYNLAERRLESDQRKNRKVVAMTQARIDGWHVGPSWGRLWFTGPTSTVFVRLQDFLFVSYDLSRLRFEPFAISPKGVVRHLDPMAPSRPIQPLEKMGLRQPVARIACAIALMYSVTWALVEPSG